MKNWLIVAVVLPLAGCIIYSGPYRETHSETVSSDGQTTTIKTVTNAGRWGKEVTDVGHFPSRLDYPFYTGINDFCDIAIVVLSAEWARGETQPVDNLFWDRDIRIGPDCASEILTAGFPVSNGEPDKETRHIIMPRQLPDNRVYVEIGSGCVARCLAGTGYVVRKRNNHWQADPEPVDSWIR